MTNPSNLVITGIDGYFTLIFLQKSGYSTNNRIGQVFWSIIQKFSFYTVRSTKISLESTGVFKSAVARKCNSFKYYYLKYKITLGDVYEI